MTGQFFFDRQPEFRLHLGGATVQQQEKEAGKDSHA
jgi:hypothetical protein